MEKKFKVCGIDHIGIVPKDDNKLQIILEKILGFKSSGAEEVLEQKTKVQKFKISSNQPSLETLAPTDPQSVIKKFQEKKGSGIHHIALKVENIEAVIYKLLQNNVKMINEEPLTGADNCKIAFLHPSSTSGILIELIEN